LSEQLDLLVANVPHARTGDPSTSHAAAHALEAEEGPTTLIRPNSAKHDALSALAARPMTALEVERDTGRRGIWKRVSDLKNAGLIEGIGTRRDPVTKRDGIVWTPNARGRAALAWLNVGEDIRL
jgi:hypothetical protein